MNPPPTYTHKVESWLLYPNKPQWESRNTPAQTNVDFSDYTQTHTHTHTHTHTGICTHIDAHCKDGTNTIAHSRFSTQPRAESRWEKNKSGNKGRGGKRSERQKWEEEMVRREAGDDERETSRLSVRAASWVQPHFFWGEFKSSHLSPKHTRWSFL